MKKAKEESIIKGFVVGKTKVEVSHLQFVDGTVFFLEPEENNFQWVVNILKIFCNMSGLKLNLDKSSISGINVDWVRLNYLAIQLGVRMKNANRLLGCTSWW